MTPQIYQLFVLERLLAKLYVRHLDFSSNYSTKFIQCGLDLCGGMKVMGSLKLNAGEVNVGNNPDDQQDELKYVDS